MEGSGTRPVMKKLYPYYLANQPVQENEDLEVTNKYTNEVATRVALANDAVVDAAIQKCVEAAPAFARMASFERKAILEQVVKELKERSEELAYILCIEAGKPIKDARGEVTRAIDTFQIAAEEAVRIHGEYAPLDISARAKGYTSIVKKFPIGPLSLISPFNFPINLAAHKIAPAIAVGCPFVLKPASKTPVGALLLGEILSHTNLPPGAFSILPCTRDSADRFTTDERFKLVSFTGSPEVGWELKKKAGKKRVVLELGGNAACVVDKDVGDLDAIVARMMTGAFYQSGQSCIGVQRLYVHQDIYDEFKEKLIAATSQLKAGDPLNEDTFLGPLISEGDAKRLEKWVNDAVAKGAKVLVGGKRQGVFYDATFVEDVDPSCDLYCKEAFGPVCTIEKFSDFKTVIAKVNDSDFGLQAGFFTNDLNKAWYAFENTEAGGVVINDVPSFRVDSMPYGGVKDSGFGREGVRYAMEDMMELRIMVMKNVGAL
ncbi:Aldehyde dehydrogenase [Balamuthia mandrillaris]